MATLLEISLPDGWTELTAEPGFNITRVGRPGRWNFIVNDDYAYWKFGVNYLRSDYETAAAKRIDVLHNFFLRAAANAFLVSDPADHTDSDRDGNGLIVQVNGVWRLVKEYGSSGYRHPITRPDDDVVVSAGTLNFDTGVVSGISSPGTWTGSYFRPCVFQENGLKLQISPNGVVAAVNVALEEQLEI
jgi:hypothetical protein